MLALAGCGGSSSSSSHPAGGSTPSTPTSTTTTSPATPTRGAYLALGDSVTFGYRESNAVPAPSYGNAADFVGYPQLVGAALRLAVVNASCPGETSASFIRPTGPSNGCESLPTGAKVGYRTAFPLHASYSGSQLAFATSYLEAHHDVRLVSLMIGANDGLRCQTATKDHCLSEIGGVERSVTRNVRHIVRALRATGYAGRLVLVTYYATDYGNPLTAVASRTINSAILAGARGQRYVEANGYTALSAAAASHHGDSCAAGLLTTLSSGGCGIHPSARGQGLLARAVERAAG